MRQDGFPPDRQAGLAGCFSRVTHPRQTEILGAIAVEILRQDRKITRITVCLKLVGRLDAAGDEADAGHLRELIGMLFRK